KGTSQGTSSDLQGHYVLEEVSSTDTLVFSFIGFQRQIIPVNGRATINVDLVPSTLTGQELVVVGYGTQKENTVTGSVASVATEELNALPVSSVQQALTGRVAGVEVTSDGGPGEDPVIQIRGISSISFATNPLFVVDGVPTSSISG